MPSNDPALGPATLTPEEAALVVAVFDQWAKRADSIDSIPLALSAGRLRRKLTAHG